MEKLNGTYENIKDILGEQAEPFESVKLVEEYRRFWKPDNIRIILLAESHVFTSDKERICTLADIPELPELPRQYANFVYCLGYGEEWLTIGQLPPKTGTPQFWKIFHSCNNHFSNLNEFGNSFHKDKTDNFQRLHNKILLLNELKDKGIWLVDTSIVALYQDGQKPKAISQALNASWQIYTRDIVLSSNPEFVICIGKGVAKIVGNDLKEHFDGKYAVLPQPNSHMTSEALRANYEAYSRICYSSDYAVYSNIEVNTSTTNSPRIKTPSVSLTNLNKKRAMYLFNDSKYGVGRLVLEVVKTHIVNNKQLSFNELLKDFPKQIQGSSGVFDTEEKAREIYLRTNSKRHFVSPDEILTLADSSIAVSNQWGNNIGNFIKRAVELGYKIFPATETLP